MGPAALNTRERSLAAVAVVLGLVALVGLRLFLLTVSLDTTIYWEEAYRLIAASEIATGARWPLFEYQADHYQGGSLLVALLAAPLVASFGKTYFVLKLVPLTFALATAVLWTVVLWRAAGPTVAALAAWLFALAPPLACIYQVHAMGSHAETALFTVGGFLLTREIMAGARARSLSFLLGVVGGIGIWFCYTAAVGVAAWGLAWLFATPRGTVRRGWPALVGGGLVGLLPWVFYNAARGFRGLDRLAELFGAAQREPMSVAEPLATRLAALVGVDLPRALGFPEAILGVPGAAAWLYYALAITALGGLVWVAFGRGGRSLEPEFARPPWTAGRGPIAALVLAAVVFDLAAYTLSSFRLDVEGGYIAYRLFSPIFPLIAVAFALVFAGLRDAGRSRLAVGGAALVLALGVYGTLALAREHVERDIPPVESGYKVMGLLTQLKYRADLVRGAELLARLPSEERSAAFFGFGWGIEFQYEKDASWSGFVQALAMPPNGADRSAALRGVEWSVRAAERQSRTEANALFRPEYSRAKHQRLVELRTRMVATGGRLGAQP